MANSKLKIDIRRNKILDRLREDGVVRVAELSRELGVTPVTVRTDLDNLEEDGYLERVQGGAVAKARTADWTEPVSEGEEEKALIAREAVKRIKDGSTLFINSGTTTKSLAAALKQHKNLNVVTNSIAVSMELGNVSSIHVILLGGEINTQYAFTFGEDAREQLRHYQADWAILSVDGVSTLAGVTTFHADEAAINRMMMERAQNTLIVADHSKIGRVGFTRLHTIDSSLQLITDYKSDRNKLMELEACGLDITIAPGRADSGGAPE
ncbi:MAG: DeoR/GlpR transcriptional regulator [Lachnospiraceae bacterium]|nr:DeoR/GlpR transcriptional regulator [Lachnospiraceae bacterium]